MDVICQITKKVWDKITLKKRLPFQYLSAHPAENYLDFHQTVAKSAASLDTPFERQA